MRSAIESRPACSGRRSMARLALAMMAAGSCSALAAQEAVDSGEPPTAAAVVQSVDPAMLPSEIAPLAAQSLLLDVAETDQRAIVVGQRGHILVSESRQDWRQLEDVPTRATLTAVATAGSHAWAVGHAQVILHSADGGLRWERQYLDLFDPDGWDDIANGAPLLDVLALDAQHVIAIGGYGLLLETSDGGATWTRGSVRPVQSAGEEPAADTAEDDAAEDDDWNFSAEDLELEELSDPHLNAIARTGSGALFIAAERGSAFRSRDQGRTWERLSIPYDGSMFGVLGYAGDRVLVFGLRGNVFESMDLGETWQALDTGTEQTLQGGAVLPDGGAVLVGSNGVVLVRRSGDEPFALHVFGKGEAGVLASVLPVGGGSQMVLIGERGIARFSAN